MKAQKNNGSTEYSEIDSATIDMLEARASRRDVYLRRYKSLAGNDSSMSPRQRSPSNGRK